eukprot:1686591-Rhodomonas_salina.1
MSSSGGVSPYERAAPCPVLTSCMVVEDGGSAGAQRGCRHVLSTVSYPLTSCYAKSGTDLADPICLHACYAMPRSNLAYPSCLHARHSKLSTDQAYGASRRGERGPLLTGHWGSVLAGNG